MANYHLDTCCVWGMGGMTVPGTGGFIGFSSDCFLSL
jgi:hypothetical protein